MRSENNQRCEKSDVKVTWAVTQTYQLTHMMSHDEFTNQRLRSVLTIGGSIYTPSQALHVWPACTRPHSRVAQLEKLGPTKSIALTQTFVGVFLNVPFHLCCACVPSEVA